MKRSEINRAIAKAIDLTRSLNFRLPPFAYWKAEEWKNKSSEYDEIREAALGWDVTDFGKNDFQGYGFTAFTIRNGRLHAMEPQKPYAEKIMISAEKQITPYHFHWNKREDIINRGGGNLMIQLYNSTPDEKFADTPVKASVDGRNFEVPAGTVLRLAPGESISLYPMLYHQFWSEEGTGGALIGEVSMFNDDSVDNRFYEPAPRYIEIEEDEAPLYCLCNEYARYR